MTVNKGGAKLYEDAALETEAHNILCAFLRKPENARKFIGALGFQDNAWTYKLSDFTPNQGRPEGMEDAAFQEILKTAKNSISQAAKIKAQELIAPELPIKILAQQPIISYGGNWILGYVDVKYLVPVELTAVIPSQPIAHPGLQQPFTATGKLWVINGSWAELSVHPGGFKAIHVVVSSHTRFPDALLRKINTLVVQTSPAAMYVIFSTDNGNRSEFEGQGIRLITPSDIEVSLD